ncbi:MAG: hypothetical protein AAF589_04400 [Planctomycetota bacterium]
MFPFDQPAPTAFYLVCYLGTLVLHVVPMNYVLAGSTYLAGLSLWEAITGKRVESQAVIAYTLRDWMPLALSVAITAGVAPLLFLQVLYKEPFYTANLLLFHRWMIILPVLITAFYLLYVQKLKRLDQGRGWPRAAVSTGILLCFAFVAWSWTENHLLSTRDQAVWIAQYESGGLIYGDRELPPRLALWYTGAFPTLAVILAWQALSAGSATKPARPLAGMALAGLVLAGVAAVVYAFSLKAETRDEVFASTRLYLGVTVVAAATQAYAWAQTWRRGGFKLRLLLFATFGALAATAGMTVVREVRRLAEISLADYYEAHARASEVGGLALFLFFFVLNAGLIAGVVVLVRSGLRRPTA